MQNLHILRVEVRSRQGVTSQDGWIRLIHQSGFESIESCASARLFFFYSALGDDQLRALAGRLLADNVTEEFRIVPVDTAAPLPELDPRHAAAHCRLLARYVRIHVAEGARLPALDFWEATARDVA